MSLRSFISELEKSESIRKYEKASCTFEAAKLERDSGGPMMTRCKENGSLIVSNIVYSRAELSLALGGGDIYEKFLKYASTPLAVRLEGMPGGYRELSSLDQLPIVHHYEKDMGPYITSGVVVAKDPTGQFYNASVHRIRKLSGDSGVIRMVEGRHLYSIYQEWKRAGAEMPIAIAVGVHPLVELYAAYQAPLKTFELDLANASLGGRLRTFESPKFRLPVPEAEYIIEATVSLSEQGEDAMAEMLGNYDFVRLQPVMKVKGIYSVDDPIYWDILPGHREHRILMGFPVEAKLNKQVKDIVPSTIRVYLSEGGANWLHAVIQIKKRLEGEPVNAILAAFAAHPSLKMAIVVDDDINPEDPVQVEYALATRFQASRGLLVIRNAKGSSLDPSSDQKRLLTDKLGIDATAPLTIDRERFELAKIPERDQA